jgi:enoyl-CoA hydratase/carnithine racemase
METGTPKLSIRIESHTAILTIQNPSANTWDLESLRALPKLMARLGDNANIWSLVITGSGEKFFSAGADLKLFRDGSIQMARDMARAFGQAFESISEFRGITIAAVNGYAMGGGLECALACDFRIAEEHAELALPEASVGLAPCAGGTQNLAWLVGEARAKRMILLGERVKAPAALQSGLVDDVCPKGESVRRAMEWVAMSEKQSPQSLKVCKELIQRARHQPMFQALTAERERFIDLFETRDQKEGVQAFLEKRKAEWSNA